MKTRCNPNLVLRGTKLRTKKELYYFTIVTTTSIDYFLYVRDRRVIIISAVDRELAAPRRRVDRACKSTVGWPQGDKRDLGARRIEGAGRSPEEGDFVVRAPKGSITKMIGSAIGGDGNCVNGVIITNLEAISSRPDQSEDAPPFPEPGPPPARLSSPRRRPPPSWQRNRIFEQLVFKSREPFGAPTFAVVGVAAAFPPSSLLCDTRKFTLAPFRLHSGTFPIHPVRRRLRPPYCAERLPGALRRNNIPPPPPRSFPAFARNNDLFYDSDFSQVPPPRSQTARETAGCQISIKLGRISGHPAVRAAIRHIILPAPGDPSHPLILSHPSFRYRSHFRGDLSLLGTHFAASYERPHSTSFSAVTWPVTHTPSSRPFPSSAPWPIISSLFLLSMSHAVGDERIERFNFRAKRRYMCANNV